MDPSQKDTTMTDTNDKPLTAEEMTLAVKRYARMKSLTQDIVRGNVRQRELAIAAYRVWVAAKEARKTGE
jgi:hypothetical protein